MKRSKRTGRYVQDRGHIKAWLILLAIGLAVGPSFVGVNNIWAWFKSFETVFVVENTLAEFYVPTWQEEVLIMVRNAGLDAELADRIIQHESWWDPNNTHVNKDGTRDRGLWMFHEVFHAEVSDACAYDWFCSTKEAIRVWKERGPQEWVAYWYVK